jgi:hypothetical protein
MACQVTLAGIRHQFPDADESQVQEILFQRIALVRWLEESSWYQSSPPSPFSSR